MCLSMMMMGGMGGGGGNFVAPLPPGSESKKYQTIMWFVLFAHLGLSIALCFVDIWTGVMELITWLILFWANSQANFWCLIFYMLRCMLGLVEMGSGVGFLIQTKKTSGKIFPFSIYWIFVVFYVFAIMLAFYAYREYKAFTVSGEGAMGGMRMPGAGAYGNNNNQPRPDAGNYQRISKE